MIYPRDLIPGTYILPEEQAEFSSEDQAYAMAADALHQVFDWIMQGDQAQRSLRLHLVILCLCPQLLPCPYPSASWCAQEYHVSRQWASRLQQDFARHFGQRLQFRGQRFRQRK